MIIGSFGGEDAGEFHAGLQLQRVRLVAFFDRGVGIEDGDEEPIHGFVSDHGEIRAHFIPNALQPVADAAGLSEEFLSAGSAADALHARRPKRVTRPRPSRGPGRARLGQDDRRMKPEFGFEAAGIQLGEERALPGGNEDRMAKTHLGLVPFSLRQIRQAQRMARASWKAPRRQARTGGER